MVGKAGDLTPPRLADAPERVMVDETGAPRHVSVDRRSFVKLAGIAAVGVPTAAPTVSPAQSVDEARMKIVALEEHFVTPALTRAKLRIPAAFADTSEAMSSDEVDRRVLDLGEERLRAMNETGVDVQVLSPAPGVQGLEPAEAVPLARDLNDLAADMVRARPDRFEGFAALPTPDPAAAARELERGVRQLGLKGGFTYGRTRERNLDHPDMWPIFEAAAALNVPIYVHPQTPPLAVREAYYSGLGDRADIVFGNSGIGWHYETGIQVVRLILAGVFDRFPTLQVVTGHWGEVVLFYLERVANMGKVVKLRRPFLDYVRGNLHVTPSGMFSPRYLHWAREVIGAERILFSSDYPYRFAANNGARAFLEGAALNADDKERIAHRNWAALTST